MNRRNFINLILAMLVIPKTNTNMWIPCEGQTISQHSIYDPGHCHNIYYCEYCRGRCKGYHHTISDPGHLITGY